MSTTVPPSASPLSFSSRFDGGGRRPAPPSTPRLAPRRRSLPYLVLGIVLVSGFAVAFAATSLRVGGRQPVLAVAQSVPAGHVLTAGDLRVVHVAADAGLAVVPASRRASVVGQPVAVPLVAGALLAPDQIGAPRFPPPGQAVVGVSVEPGRYPPGLEAGARVAVLVIPGQDNAAGPAVGGGQAGQGAVSVTATVVGVQAGGGDQQGGVVVSLLLAEDAAMRVAGAASGQVSLVLLSPGGSVAGGGGA